MTSSVLLALLFVANSGAHFNLTILHTGNLMSMIFDYNSKKLLCKPSDEAENECVGGYSRIGAKVKEIRKLRENTLFLDAGDAFDGGTTVYHLFKGVAQVDVMNEMGYDAMTLGENEFRDGVEVLTKFLQNLSFPVVACNADFFATKIGRRGLVKHHIKKTFYFPNHAVVGVVGYIFPGASQSGKTGKVIFQEEIRPLQETVDKLRGIGINKIVAIGHSGLIRDEELAQKVDGIDVIVGGHYDRYHGGWARAHLFYTGKPPSKEKAEKPYPYVLESASGEPILLVHAYKQGKYLGNLNVQFDGNGRVVAYDGNPILMDHTVEKDPQIEAVVLKYLPVVKKYEETVIATSLVDFPDINQVCRRQECNYGNLVTDAMVESIMTRYDGSYWTHAPIAVFNGGGLLGDIKANIPITFRDVLNTMPYTNELVLVEVTGEILKSILEVSVKDYGVEWRGHFLQFSGLWVTYDARRPPFSRVVTIETRCMKCSVPAREPMGSKKIYTVIMPSFIAKGGASFTMLKELPKEKKTFMRGLNDADIVMDYIKKKRRLFHGLEGRIKFLPLRICNATRIYCLSLFHLLFLYVLIQIIIL